MEEMLFSETDFPVQPRQSSPSYPTPSARITRGTHSLVSFIFMYTFHFCPLGSFTWPLMSFDFHEESNSFFPSSCLSGDFAFSFSKELSRELIPGWWLSSSSALWTPPLCFLNSVVSGEKAVSGSSYWGSPVSDIIFLLLLSRSCFCLWHSAMVGEVWGPVFCTWR